MGKGEKELENPEPWLNRVLTDSMIFQEYGLPYDLRELPVREFQAHKALLLGMRIDRANTKKEMEKKQKKAERQARAGRY